MNYKLMLTIIGSFAAGGLAGIVGTKKYFQNKYQKKYDQDREDLEAYYHKVDEYARVDHDEEKTVLDTLPTINFSQSIDAPAGGRMTKEQRKDIKNKLAVNWAGTTNYASMYKDVDSIDTDESTMIDENYPNEVTPEEEAFDNHQKNKDKPPKIISSDAYSNLPAHIDQEVLYFYAYDETLTDENKEPIEEPERLIGDSLTKYDFIDSEERVIFVMNYALDTCYEIQKLDASWSD